MNEEQECTTCTGTGYTENPLWRDDRDSVAFTCSACKGGGYTSDDYVNFDLDRMKEAISGPSLTLPNNLTREEMRWYICNASIGSREGLFIVPDGLSMEELTVFAKEMYNKFRGNDD